VALLVGQFQHAFGPLEVAAEQDGRLAVAEGVPDPQMFALLLDCVPGIAPDDWQPEPSPLAEMNPGSGEIIWSTLFPSEVANEILELDVDD
jgi:hypothetical protein